MAGATFDMIHVSLLAVSLALSFPFAACRVVSYQGLVLTPEAEQQFSCEERSPVRFEFVVSDIQEIRPIVRVS